ncbi:MAG: AraC family transcriptional regulator ligand-binding domain-containing protein [Alcanivoracaceae bacterium]|nr:AraC family transcriptional regulator ligand-binding domain-containing protein [Alcanivoracaceae bacterium]
MAEQDFYVSGIALSQFVLGAERLGMNARDYVRRAGLDPQVHLNPLARVPMAPYEQVLLELILDSEDELFGIHIGEQMMLPLYGYLVPLALNSATLLDAIRAAIAFQALVAGNVGSLGLVEHDDVIEINGSAAHQNPVIRRHTMECVLVLLANLFRTICGRPNLAAEHLYLEHPPSSERARAAIEEKLLSPLTWNNGPTRFFLSYGTARITLHSHGEDSLRSLEALAQQQLTALQDRDSVIDDIKWHMRDLIISGTPRRITVAERLNTSLRTLDRRLSGAGISWQALLDQQRSQLAREYLADSTLTVAAIAERLGFSDVRAFQRRFRVWAGTTPSDYRAGLQRQH